MSEHGSRAEDFVEDLCRRSFLADFVVRAPMFTKGGGGQREAADLLLPFKDKLVSFQVRARLLPATGEPDETDLGRISRRIEKAVQQVKTVRRALDAGSISTVENLRGIQMPFDCTRYRSTVGIVVVDLVPQRNIPEEQQLALYGGIDRVRDIPVHVFLKSDLEVLLQELDTIPDFLTYLEVREQMMRRRIILPITHELDLLAMFQTQYDKVRRCIDGDVQLLVIEDGLWEATKRHNLQQFKDREARWRASQLVDKTIESVHKCIGHDLTDNLSDVGGPVQGGPASVQDYLVIAEHLVGLTRSQRMDLGEVMLKKAKRADSDPKEFSYSVFMPGGDQITIVFLSSRSDRRTRRRQLYKVACVAYVHLNLKSLLAIACDNFSANGISQDFLVFDGIEFDNADELRQLGPSFFGPAQRSSRDQWGNDYAPKQ